VPAGSPARLCPHCLLGLGSLAKVGLAAPEPVGAAEQTGARIGRYKLIEVIGEGGFGTVWLAEQEEPVRRKVALKIIKPGMDTREVVARFEAERQALALMDHPNIARVFDGGATENGRPYFVMELVRGVRLTEYCDLRRASTEERLRLLIQVCEAVQHAHQKGVIHRDLKPSNVLVMEQDGRAIPKVIDFGIAKATELELTGKTLLTRFNQLVGTPAYMSPEQAGLGALDIDTRSDIYSLGVLLYELLTGQTPFSDEELRKAGLDQVLRIIREKEPAKPSTQLSMLTAQDLHIVAQHRGAEPERLNRRVKGELDWIVMKCLEKDRARRYETANGLARDLERHLNHEAIVAAPPGFAYQLAKFSSRYRVVLVTAGAFALLLLAGTGVSLWQAVRANRFAARETVARNEAMTNWVNSQRSLYNSRLTQARTQLAAKAMGQHHDVLATLKAAATLDPNMEVRSEAVAALVKPDFRLLTNWPMYVPVSGTFVGFAPSLQSYVGARAAREGASELREAETGSLLASLPHRTRGATNLKLTRSLFSPDGRYFAAFFQGSAADVWSVDGPRKVMQLGASEEFGNFDFTPDASQFVGYSTNDGLCVWTLADGSRRQILPPKNVPRAIRLNPEGNRLAVVGRTTLKLLDFPEGQTVWSAPVAGLKPWVAWHPQGRSLAVANIYLHEILLYDALKPTVLGRMIGPTEVRAFEFHPNGQWLLSQGAGSLRLWDLRSAQELLHVYNGADTALQFSKDGTRFVAGRGPNDIGIYELTLPRGFREFRSTAAVAFRVHTMDISSSGRFLLTACNAGLRIWDIQSGCEVAVLDRPAFNGSYRVFFGPNDMSIIYSRKDEGTFRRQFTWRDAVEGQPAVATLGPEERTEVPQNTFLCSVGPDRRTWLSRDSSQGGAMVMPDGRMENSRTVCRASERMLIELSPDGQWSAAVCNDDRRYLEVWDAKKLTVATNMGDLYTIRAVFSPDSRWLISASESGYDFWETGTWQHRYFCAAPGMPFASMSFTSDSRLVALLHAEDILLVSLPDGRELLRFKPPLQILPSAVQIAYDGSRVWALGLGQRVFEWNLITLRKELGAMGLDWQN
jgi:WD40 repeat protein